MVHRREHAHPFAGMIRIRFDGLACLPLSSVKHPVSENRVRAVRSRLQGVACNARPGFAKL